MRLTNESILRSVEEMRVFCSRHKAGSRQCKRISLEVEEVLLNFQEHFGTEAEYEVTMKSYLGFPLLRIGLRGESFDPLSVGEDDEYYEVMHNLVSFEDAKPTWRYVNGENRVTISVSRRVNRSTIFSGPLVLSLVAAVTFVLLCRFLPAEIVTLMLEDVITPMFSAMMRLLVGVTGPVVFLSLVTGILATGSISALKKTGGKIMKHVAILTLLSILVSTAVCRLFFSWQSGGSTAFDLGEMLTLILSFIPESITAPFADNNLLQIVFMAVLTGIVLIMLEERVKPVKELITYLNVFAQRTMNAVSAVIPVLIFVSVVKSLLESSPQQLAEIWKLIAAQYSSAIVCGVLMLVYIKLRRGVSLRKLIAKIKPVLTVTFTTASGTAAMEPNFKACHEMGVDDEFAKLCVPLTHVMFSPAIVVSLIGGVLFMVDMYDVTVSLSWLITFGILIFQFGFASAKVPGGIIAIYSILFLQLGIPTDSIGILAAANALIINFTSAYGMLVRDCDIIDLAFATNSIDVEKFNS